MTISDEFMREMVAKMRRYSVVILSSGPKANQPDAQKIAWEHARRNFQLRAEGKLAIVCPVMDGTEVRGVGIFSGDLEETRRLMEGDPGVQAGIFSYEIHACASFPGDVLPK